MESASTAEFDADLAQTGGDQVAWVREDLLQKLLDLLELASRRGAFELEEFRDVHEVYTGVRERLQLRRRPRR
jgi:hypothetical protein